MFVISYFLPGACDFEGVSSVIAVLERAAQLAYYEFST